MSMWQWTVPIASDALFLEQLHRPIHLETSGKTKNVRFLSSEAMAGKALKKLDGNPNIYQEKSGFHMNISWETNGINFSAIFFAIPAYGI